MPTRFAWPCTLVLLPFLAVDPVRAELPGGPAFVERMASSAREPTLPEAKSVAAPAAVQPVRLPRLSSRFGSRRDPFDGRSRFHAGIDIPGTAGSPVFASAAGTVIFAGSAGGYGRMVEIDHGNGMRTRYGHLARLLVTPGARVAQGEIVGRMGSTGRSTGTHLHFEVRQDGGAVDPLARLSSAPASRPATVRGSSDPHLSDFAKARQNAALSGDGN